jgi:riboflavin kinase / FMN adenylyltransferase
MIADYGFISGKFSLNSTVAIGNFDGVHLGHTVLIEHAKSIAKKNNTSVGVITFDPNPIEYFQRNNEPFYLTSLQEKVSYIINKCGVDFVYIVKFSTISNLSAEDYFKKILIDKLSVSGIIVGENHMFGANKTGNIETLRHLCKEYKIIIEPVLLHKHKDETIISSGVIRGCIKNGDIKTANKLLGRNFCITGVVVRGSQIAGTTLQHKTANLFTEVRYVEPKYGVYAIFAKLNGVKYPAIANFGIRPTFNHTNPHLEVHILNHDLPDFYGERISVEFIEYIRLEQKFSSIDDLKAQIYKDCQACVNILSYVKC